MKDKSYYLKERLLLPESMANAVLASYGNPKCVYKDGWLEVEAESEVELRRLSEALKEALALDSAVNPLKLLCVVVGEPEDGDSSPFSVILVKVSKDGVLYEEARNL